MIILFVFSAAGLMSSWIKTLKNYRMKKRKNINSRSYGTFTNYSVYAGIVDNFMTVGDLQQGDMAVVKLFLGDLDRQSRFLEMGILPGVELRLVKIAPLGGTIELKVRNYYVSIRQQDALNIVIEN